MGIDLGTTFSCVGLWRPGDEEPQILANDRDNKTTASVVSYEQGDQITVGGAAIDAGVQGGAVVYDVKRLIGRSINDRSVEGMRANWPFELAVDD